MIAKSPFDPKMNICKRVIGLEGDKVCTSGPLDPFKTHTFVSINCVCVTMYCVPDHVIPECLESNINRINHRTGLHITSIYKAVGFI